MYWRGRPPYGYGPAVTRCEFCGLTDCPGDGHPDRCPATEKCPHGKEVSGRFGEQCRTCNPDTERRVDFRTRHVVEALTSLADWCDRQCAHPDADSVLLREEAAEILSAVQRVKNLSDLRLEHLATMRDEAQRGGIK